MKLTAHVLHNIGETMFFGYHPEGSELFHAHDFEIWADNADTAADLIWTLTNVDDANHLASIRSDLGQYGPQVTAYRQRRNRSLSVGDVIVFYEGDHFVATMAVESLGHKYYSRPAPFKAGSNDEPVSQSYLAYERLLETQRSRG